MQSYYFHPRLWWAALTGRGLVPWLHVSDITQIDIGILSEAGVRGLIFDVDNTLTGHSKNTLSSEHSQSLHRLCTAFKCVLFSNCRPERHSDLPAIFSDYDHAGIVSHRYKKPLKGGFREALRLLDLPVEQCAMVGDRVLTDVLGANWYGFKPILVDPFDADEPSRIRRIRRFERRFL